MSLYSNSFQNQAKESGIAFEKDIIQKSKDKFEVIKSKME